MRGIIPYTIVLILTAVSVFSDSDVHTATEV
jgi:hypothetical protein